MRFEMGAAFVFMTFAISRTIGAVLGGATGSFFSVGGAAPLAPVHEGHDSYCLFYFLHGKTVVGLLP